MNTSLSRALCYCLFILSIVSCGGNSNNVDPVDDFVPGAQLGSDPSNGDKSPKNDGEDEGIVRFTVEAGAPQIADIGTTVSLTGEVTLPENVTIVSYLWTQLSGSEVTLTSPTSSNTTFSSPNSDIPEELVFQLQVTGSNNVVISDSVRIAVNPLESFIIVSSVTVFEALGTAEVEFILTRESSTATSIDFETQTLPEDSAEAGSDYEASSGTIIFSPGETSKIITIAILADEVGEGTEIFTLFLSNSDGATIFESSPKIQITDITPSISLPLIEAQAIERDGEVIINLTLSAITPLEIRVPFSINESSTATETEDYILPSTLEIVIPPNSDTGVLTISLVNDGTVESEETIIINLEDPEISSELIPGNREFIIYLSDSNTSIVNFANTSATVVEGSGLISIQATLTNAFDTDTVVNFSVTVEGENLPDDRLQESLPREATSLHRATVKSRSVVMVTTTGVIFYDRNEFTLNDESFIFLAGETEASIEVDITENDIPGNTVTVTFELNGSDYLAPGDNSQFTLSILDNEPTVVFTTLDSTIAEENGAGIILEIALLGGPIDRDLLVPYSTASEGTTAGSADYELNPPNQITIGAGESSVFITLTPIDDQIPENNEFIDLFLVPTTAHTNEDSSLTITIIDTDTEADEFFVSFESSSSTIEEGGNAGSQIRAISSSSKPIDWSISFTVNDTSSATNSEDFDFETLTLNFAAGETTSSDMLLFTNDDNIVEGNETVVLNIANDPDYTLGAIPQHSLTITDNDIAVLSFAITEDQLSELNTSEYEIFVNLSSTHTEDVSVELSFGGTADPAGDSSGGDYLNQGGTSLVIPAGESSGTIVLSILDDEIPEATETITIELQNPSNATLGTNSIIILNITDEGDAYEVSFANANFQVNEGSGTLDVTINISPAVVGSFIDIPFTVDLGLTSATSGVDYSIPDSPIRVDFGATTAVIQVTLLDDTEGETNEALALHLLNNDDLITSSPSTTIITINDNEPVVSFESLSSSTSEDTEGGTDINVVSTFSQPFAWTVTLSIDDSSTATLQQDYEFEVLSATFAAGSTISSPITIFPWSDGLDEDDETVILTIDTGEFYSTDSEIQHTLTLVDNDVAALSFAIIEASVTEATISEFLVVVNLGATLTENVTVDLLFDGNAIMQNIDAAGDYGNTTGDTLTILAGNRSGTITLSINEDNLAENTELVTIELENPIGALLGNNTTYTLSIEDNEPTVSFTTSTQEIDESATASAVVTIDLGQTLQNAMTIEYSVLATSTASAGDDYTTNSPGTISVGAGSSSVSIIIDVVSDSEVEGNETIEFLLNASSFYHLDDSNSSHTLTILEDDFPFINAPTGGLEALESAGIHQLDISLTQPYLDGVTVVSVELSIESIATMGEDFTIIPSAQISFPPGSTIGTIRFPAGTSNVSIQFNIINDRIAENPESIRIHLSDATNASIIEDINDFNFDIIDDIDPQFALGKSHSCLLDDSGVNCWGEDYAAEIVSIPALNLPFQIDSGAGATCVLDDTEIGPQIMCWGTDSTIVENIPTLLSIKKVVVGNGFACALHQSGIDCWGGRLENPEIPWQPRSDVVSPEMLTAGEDFICALDSGMVKCFGASNSSFLQMYTDDEFTSLIDVQASSGMFCALSESGENTVVSCSVETDADFRIFNNTAQIDAGNNFACILDSNEVTCSGDNTFGQSTAPSLSNPKLIGTGYEHACALDDNGISCWGHNDYGQSTPQFLVEQMELATTGSAPNCSITTNPTTALKTNLCWGSSAIDYPQIDNPTWIKSGRYTCVNNATNNEPTCWNINENGAVEFLAIPSRSSKMTMIEVSRVNPNTGQEFGFPVACAVDEDGFYCWQLNRSTGTIVVQESPLPITVTVTDMAVGLNTCAAFSSFSDNLFECFFLSDGGISNSDIPATVSNNIIAVSTTYVNAGIKGPITCVSDQGVPICWFGGVSSGTSTYNLQILDTPVLDSVIDIESSSRGVCALNDDSTVNCWTYDSGSLLPISTPTLTKVTSITMNDTQMCAVDDNQLKCWGYTPLPAPIVVITDLIIDFNDGPALAL